MIVGVYTENGKVVLTSLNLTQLLLKNLHPTTPLSFPKNKDNFGVSRVLPIKDCITAYSCAQLSKLFFSVLEPFTENGLPYPVPGKTGEMGLWNLFC